MLHRGMIFAAGAYVASVAFASTTTRAADFYAGRTLTIIVGNDVGGGFDAYARLFARHLSRVIPGQPGLVVQNMPGAGSSSSDYAKLHRTTSALNFDIVSGYKGTGDILLAMERREVDGFCGVDWASLTSQRPDWIRDGKINLLFEVGVKPNPELTARKVPLVWDSTINPEARAVVELVTSQQDFARPYIMAADNPAEAVKLLRTAFAQLYKDDKFVADAEKSALILSPTSGEEVQAMVGKLYAAPKEIVDAARNVLK